MAVQNARDNLHANGQAQIDETMLYPDPADQDRRMFFAWAGATVLGGAASYAAYAMIPSVSEGQAAAIGVTQMLGAATGAVMARVSGGARELKTAFKQAVAGAAIGVGLGVGTVAAVNALDDYAASRIVLAPSAGVDRKLTA